MTMSMQCVMQFIRSRWCLSKHFICFSRTYSAPDGMDHCEVKFFRFVIFCFKLLRKFQGAMQIVAVAEIAVRIFNFCSFPSQKNLNFCDEFCHIPFILKQSILQIFINMGDSLENYWFRLLLREWAQFCIFLYIGYICSSFSVLSVTANTL